MLSDIFLMLLIAYILLLVVAYSEQIPFIYIIAGMIAFLLAFQAFAETSEPVVGIALACVGLVTLLGGLHEATEYIG